MDQHFDFAKAPKQFCENVVIGYTNESFVLALFSGNAVGVYAFAPEHAKRLMQSLKHNIEHYEKEFGEIKAEWHPGMPSPIQISGSSGHGKGSGGKK